MTNQEENVALEVRMRLVEVAGRTTQDLGMGRILGQVLCDVYLAENECSLDDIGERLGLSKASISIAARQLENLGLLHRVWKAGDRKNYYRIVDDFGTALRQGLLELLRGKMRAAGAELDRAEESLNQLGNGSGNDEIKFLENRLKRAKHLRKRAVQILDSPFMKLLR